MDIAIFVSFIALEYRLSGGYTKGTYEMWNRWIAKCGQIDFI